MFFVRKRGFFKDKNNKWRHWNDYRIEIFQRDNFTCRNCGRRFEAKELVLDHIIPIACGGDEFDENNLQTLCAECHLKKTKEDKRIIAGYKREGEKALELRKNGWIPFDDFKFEFFKQNNFTCKICGRKFEAEKLALDFILPIACGGSEFDESNFQVLCVECYEKKKEEDKRLIAEYKKEGEKALRLKQAKLTLFFK